MIYIIVSRHNCESFREKNILNITLHSTLQKNGVKITPIAMLNFFPVFKKKKSILKPCTYTLILRSESFWSLYMFTVFTPAG